MINVETPTTYSLEQTHETMRRVEGAVGELRREELESYVTLSGATYRDQSAYRTGAHLGQVFVELAEGGARTRSTEEIQDEIRAKIGRPEGIQRMDVTAPAAGPGGKDIELTLSGPDSETLRRVTDELEAYLAGFAAIKDLRDDVLPGSREIRMKLTDEGRMLGFNEALVAQQVLGAFAGDRATIVRLERRVLEGAGYRVLTASSGEEGFEVWKDNRRSIDLLVTDVIMPGMSGRELADRLVQAGASISVLFVSGYARDEFSQEIALDAGIDLLPKPFTPRMLLAKVRANLDARVSDSARDGGGTGGTEGGRFRSRPLQTSCFAEFGAPPRRG